MADTYRKLLTSFVSQYAELSQLAAIAEKHSTSDGKPIGIPRSRLLRDTRGLKHCVAPYKNGLALLVRRDPESPTTPFLLYEYSTVDGKYRLSQGTPSLGNGFAHYCPGTLSNLKSLQIERDELGRDIARRTMGSLVSVLLYIRNRELEIEVA